MGALEDPFEALAAEETTDDLRALANKPLASQPSEISPLSVGACIARFHGFDMQDQPLVTGMSQLPGEIVLARTTVRLLRETVGADVVVLCEQGDPRRPIIMGVVGSKLVSSTDSDAQPLISVDADEDRYVISAEREIVLKCGDSSITLTRAGKVIIKGNYILSRSSGYNKVKGAAVDIN
jgi:hypothetical protein